MVSTLLSSVSSTEWLNKNSLEKQVCRSRSSVGRAFGSLEKTGVGGLGVGSSPTDSNKKVPFF